ncbi:MAG TPA: pantoate--beta-alanine ligase [Prolixibacteraceae bacterium]|nr:pantoate--beta-alanine ligase [Prolixibacteraceae bacterium]
MYLVKTEAELQAQLNEFRIGGSVGFVPTMGALHAGHLSLVNKAMTENEVVVTSIFVNPTQFNDANDLKRYPRNLKADLELLKPTGCQLVFAPEAEEVYPEPDTRKFDFGTLETVMEGKHRPGHFNGVAQVVSRLFDMVRPNKAYFGQKDFQQLSVIKKMVEQQNLPVEIVPCRIIREKSGLAMSSRNELLTAEERENAAQIYKTLTEAKNLARQKSVNELQEWIVKQINNNPLLSVEYIEIVEDKTLQPVQSWSDDGTKVACAAVFCGKVRLIDNLVLN